MRLFSINPGKGNPTSNALAFPKRSPGRIRKTFSAIKKAACTTGNFFLAARDYSSLIYNLLRYPESMRYIVPHPAQKKDKTENPKQ